MQCRLLLDVVVAERAPVLQLLARENEALLLRRDALLILDLGFHILDGVAGLDVERDRLACRPAKAAGELGAARALASASTVPVRVFTKICILTGLTERFFLVSDDEASERRGLLPQPDNRLYKAYFRSNAINQV